MPIKTIRIRTSNVSGAEIPEKTGGTLRLKVDGKVFRADLTDAELRKLAKELKAEEVKPRERKAGSKKTTRAAGSRRRGQSGNGQQATPAPAAVQAA